MTDPDVIDDVLHRLAVVRGRLKQVWHDVEDLKDLGRGAERAIDDAEAETMRARATTDDVVGALHLRSTGAQMEIVRRLCADSAGLAGEIAERLEAAKGHLSTTQQKLAALDDTVLDGALPLDEVSDLRARVESLAGVVDLATPMAQAARTHMHEAASIAASLTTSNLALEDHQHTTARVDVGLRTASREVVRADEAAKHLDRTVDHAMSGAERSMGSAENVDTTARNRLRSAQRHESSSPSVTARPGPRR